MEQQLLYMTSRLCHARLPWTQRSHVVGLLPVWKRVAPQAPSIVRAQASGAGPERAAYRQRHRPLVLWRILDHVQLLVCVVEE